MSSKICSSCQHDNDNDANFCEKCAHDLSVVAIISQKNDGPDAKRSTPSKWFWNKQYTRPQLLKESRWLLIFVAVVHAFMGWERIANSKTVETSQSGIGLVIIGIIYLIVALQPYFWIRFIFLAVWVIDLTYTAFFMENIKVGSKAVFLIIGYVFIYKMWTYRKMLNDNGPIFLDDSVE